MKGLFVNLILFVIFSIVFSSLTVCNRAGTQSVSTNENMPKDNSNATKKVEYPPAPSGLMKAEFKDLEGNTLKLEDKKGKVVLVNLWAIWCGPCIAEMPELVKMQNEYKDKDFEVLGLNVGDEDGMIESVENIKAFAEEKKLNYQLGYAENHFRGEMLRITKMAGIPQSVLINREGQLTGVFTGGGNRVVGQMKESVEKTVNSE